MGRVDSLYVRLPTQEILLPEPLSKTDQDVARSRGQFQVKQYPATGAGRIGHSLGQTRLLTQRAPPSRIMLGGAVLNPTSAIPRQLPVCGGAIRFNGQIQAALLFDLSELLP